jgi:hypothetical protein
MSHQAPRPDCREVTFPAPVPIEPASQVALEDYARVVSGANAAQVVELGTGLVSAVHLCGVAALNTAAERDIADFAAELRSAVPGGRLGWS